MTGPKQIVKSVKRRIGAYGLQLDGTARRLAREDKFGAAFRRWWLADKFGASTSEFSAAEEAMLQSRVRQALEISVRQALKNPISGTSRLWQLSWWLARDGHFEVVEESWLRLLEGRGTKRLARGKLLQLWGRLGIFGDENIERAKAFLTRGVEAKNARYGLRFLYEYGVPPSELIPHYQRYVWKAKERGRIALGADLASLYGLIGDTGGLQELVERLGRLAEETAHKSLYLARYLTEHPIAGHAVDAGLPRIGALLSAFSDGAGWLNAMLAAGKRVAIVGNSTCEVGLGRGAEIDAHDVVIRFNRFSRDPDFVADYGAKTNLLVVNVQVVPTIQLPEEIDGVLLTAPDYEVFPNYINSVARWHEAGIKLAVLPRDLIRQLTRSLSASPSSGMRTIHGVNRLRGNLEGVSFYGFSGTDQVGANPAPANYGRKSKPSFRHNWHGEAAMLADLRAGQANKLTPAEMRGLRQHSKWRSLAEFKPTRIKFVGDHSAYHCGSAAVADYIKRKLRYHGSLVTDDEYDVLVVNGEGSMHHDSQAFHTKMQALRQAVESGRDAMLINTVWQDNGHEYDDVLRQLKQIVVREALSQRELLEKHGVKSRLVPDFSFSAPLFKLKESAVQDYAGSVVITDFFSREYGGFVKIAGGRLARYPYVNMKKMPWSELIHSLKSASLLITGRHHAMYAACKAEIPFVVFSGNSHKIDGLFVSAGIDVPVCRGIQDLDAAVDWAKANRDQYKALFRWLKRQPEWHMQL